MQRINNIPPSRHVLAFTHHCPALANGR